MPTETNEATLQATAPAEKRNETVQSSGNLSLADAAAQLLAKPAKQVAPKAEAQAAEQVAAPAGESPAELPPVEEAAPAADETSTETPAAEVSKEAETEVEKVEGDADDVLSPHSSLDPKTKEKIQRRIDKEVSKRKALESKTSEVEARLAAIEAERNQLLQAQQTQPQQTVAAVPSVEFGVTAQYNDVPSLEQFESQTKKAELWAERTIHTPSAWKTKTVEDPNTGETSIVKVTKLGDAEYTEDQLHEMRINAREMVETVIPRRKQFLTVQAQSRQAAYQALPFLKDRASPEYQTVQNFLRDPWIQQSPHAEWFAGVYIKGLNAIKAEQAAAQATPPKPVVKAPVKKPPSDQTAVSSTTSSARIPINSGNKAALEAERTRLANKGGITAAEAAASLLRKDQLRNSL